MNRLLLLLIPAALALTALASTAISADANAPTSSSVQNLADRDVIAHHHDEEEDAEDEEEST